MGNINRYNLTKWYKMLTGKSILHVNQGVGKIYSKKNISGYYNDLTEKITKGENANHIAIPKFKLENGDIIEFPIGVFQYGLGSYDLYLLENEELYLNKFKLIVEWALENQEENGAWSNFYYIYPDAPYSAMAQGEGASLLVRGYKEFGDEKYLLAAKKAIEFMLLPIEKGGTTLYKGDDVFFQEYTHKPTVLNGWIFAIFGIFDYVKVTNDEKTAEVLRITIRSIKDNLQHFDNGYWSTYNNEGMLTSMFYHDLHISQLIALYDLFNIEEFKEYSNKWESYKDNSFYRKLAFVVEVYQKLTEK